MLCLSQKKGGRYHANTAENIAVPHYPYIVCYRVCVPISLPIQLHAAIRFCTSPVYTGTCHNGAIGGSRGRFKGTACRLPHQPLRSTHACNLAHRHGGRNKRTAESHLILRGAIAFVCYRSSIAK